MNKPIKCVPDSASFYSHNAMRWFKRCILCGSTWEKGSVPPDCHPVEVNRECEKCRAGFHIYPDSDSSCNCDCGCNTPPLPKEEESWESRFSFTHYYRLKHPDDPTTEVEMVEADEIKSFIAEEIEKAYRRGFNKASEDAIRAVRNCFNHRE